MAKQSRSIDEPAGLLDDFQRRISRQGLVVSGDDDGQFNIPLPAYSAYSLGPPVPALTAFDAPGAPREYQPQFGSPATPNASLTEYSTPVDMHMDTNWSGYYGGGFYDYGSSANNPALAIDPNLDLLLAERSSSLGAFGASLFNPLPSHEDIGAFNRLLTPSTPALTQADSLEGAPNHLSGPHIGNTTAAGPSQAVSCENLLCVHCGASIKGIRSLGRHTKEVHGSQRYECRCGHCCARKANYTRHLKVCKLLKGGRDARQAHFMCSCGKQHEDLSAHKRHIEGCGRLKVGRPARAG